MSLYYDDDKGRLIGPNGEETECWYYMEDDDEYEPEYLK